MPEIVLSREELKEQGGYQWVSPEIEGGLRRVKTISGRCFHVQPDGTRIYEQDFEWVDPFRDDRARVVGDHNQRFHIQRDGTPAYKERYDWVEEFADGYAMATIGEQRYRIQPDGTRVEV